MDKQRFKELLKLANISKKELAELLNISQVTVNGWGSTQSIPYWMESWLVNRIKANYYDEIINMVDTTKEILNPHK